MKHTKGEWVAQGTNIFLIDNSIPAYKLARVQQAVYYEVKISKAEAEANTRLMASAPDMVDVLEVALRRLEEKSDHSNRDIGFINKMRNVLKKAIGE